jgi:hypothetical protein
VYYSWIRRALQRILDVWCEHQVQYPAGPIFNDENGSRDGQAEPCINSSSARNQSSSGDPMGPPRSSQLIGEFLNFFVLCI